MTPPARRYRSVLSDNARWDGFSFRDGDIIISTPSKCGTTWMQMICALLIFQNPQLPGPLTDLSPWLEVQTDTVEHVFAALETQTHRRFIKSHTPYDGLPHDSRVMYITVGRDPRDAAISWDNHMANMNLDAVIGARAEAVGLDDLAEFSDGLPLRADDPLVRFWHWIDSGNGLESGVSGLAGLLHHLETFWVHRDEPNVVMVHYADLKADLEGEMRRLAGALDITVAEERWPALVSAATFDRMRDRAGELAPQVTVDGFWNDPAGFFNKGASGQWRGYFGPGDVERYQARVGLLAPPDLADWVHTGWRAQADPDG